MELYIAGGCGEHGRNCFFVEGEGTCFLVDCGAMAGEPESPNPRLDRERICRLDAVFLTHSHGDHTGALPWLLQCGYHGPIIAAAETLRQLPWELPNRISLESLCPQGAGRLFGLSVTWGRSGHCAGSVWYRFEEKGKSILFSGDYTEEAVVYACDPIRGQRSDLAVLDCAYGRDDTTYPSACGKLLRRTAALLEAHGSVLFPVPKYGRGLELLKLFDGKLGRAQFWGDALFLRNLAEARAGGFWFQSLDLKAAAAPYEAGGRGIVFVSDPQLRTEAAREMAKAVLSSGGKAIMTGTVEDGSYSAWLMETGNMELLRYPVHQTFTQYRRLMGRNQFRQAIPYHSPELPVEPVISF